MPQSCYPRIFLLAQTKSFLGTLPNEKKNKQTTKPWGAVIFERDYDPGLSVIISGFGVTSQTPPYHPQVPRVSFSLKHLP